MQYGVLTDAWESWLAMPGKISCLRIAPSEVVRFTDCCLCIYRSRGKFWKEILKLVYIVRVFRS